MGNRTYTSSMGLDYTLPEPAPIERGLTPDQADGRDAVRMAATVAKGVSESQVVSFWAALSRVAGLNWDYYEDNVALPDLDDSAMHWAIALYDAVVSLRQGAVDAARPPAQPMGHLLHDNVVEDAVQAVRDYAASGKVTNYRHDYVLRMEIARLAGFAADSDIGIGDSTEARWMIALYDALDTRYALRAAAIDLNDSERDALAVVQSMANNERGSITHDQEEVFSQLLRRLVGIPTYSTTSFCVNAFNAKLIARIADVLLGLQPVQPTPQAAANPHTLHPVRQAMKQARTNAPGDTATPRDTLAIGAALMAYLADLGMEPAAAPGGFSRVMEAALHGKGVTLAFLEIIEDIFINHHRAYTIK